MIISHLVLLKMGRVLDKSSRENQNILFLCPITFSADGAVYDIKWKNMVEADSPQMAIRHMRFGCWISKATDTRSEYEILTVFHSNNSYANAPQGYVFTYIAPLILNLVDMPRTSG